MKVKFINESLKDILKPKNDNDIMSNLLETNIENISLILKIYKKWKPILHNKNIRDKIKINFFINDIYKYHFSNEKTTGFLGLKITFNRYLETSNQFNLDICLEVIKMWINWVEYALKEFYKNVNHEYKINESIKDVLKPKSQEEIDQNLNKLSGDELMYVWSENEENIKILKLALKKGINLSEWNLRDIIYALNKLSDDELNKLIFPYVLEDFPYNIKKHKDAYKLTVSDWSDFIDLFENTQEIRKSTINSILLEVSNIFDYNISDIHLNDYKDQVINFNNDKVLNLLKDKLIKESKINNIQILSNINALKEIYEFIQNNENNLKELSIIIKESIAEAQRVADENAAINDLKNNILSFFGLNEPEIVNNSLIFNISPNEIVNVYKVYNNIQNGIYCNPNRWHDNLDEETFWWSLFDIINEENI